MKDTLGIINEMKNDAVETEIEGVLTWVLGAEHLVAIVLKTGRAKDHARVVRFLEHGAVNAENRGGR